MTTPTSSLGMSHIQTEFGGSNPIALSEYYGVHGNVATSGTIKMSQFLGISSGPPVKVNNVSTIASDLAAAEARHTHYANGKFIAAKYEQDAGGWTNTPNVYNWLVSGSASSYDIRVTKTTGGTGASPTFSAGWANNTWANLNSDRYFYLAESGNGLQDVYVTVEIKWNANSTVIASNTHYLLAEDYK